MSITIIGLMKNLALILFAILPISAFRVVTSSSSFSRADTVLKGALYTGSGSSSSQPDKKRGNISQSFVDKRKGVQKRDIAAEDEGGGGLFKGGEALEPSYQEDAFGAPVGPLPSVSGKLNWEDVEVKDELAELYIVGAGTLGTELARQMVAALGDEKEDRVVVAETLTDARHDELLDIGVLPRLRDDRSEDDRFGSKNVIICIPPSMSRLNEGGYPEELFDAATLWAGPKGGGVLVLVSSTAVYGPSDQNYVTETFRLDTRSQRSTRMIHAEEATLSRDGTVLRLGGLYNERRGPHSMWMKRVADGEHIEGDSDGILNMLHYEDAAAVALRVIQQGRRNTVYLASDGNTISRKEMCDAAMVSGLFPNALGKEIKFTSVAGYSKGKTVDSTWTNEELNWTPKYPSFNSFMRRLGGEDVPDPVRREKKDDDDSKSGLLWTPGDDESEWAI